MTQNTKALAVCFLILIANGITGRMDYDSAKAHPHHPLTQRWANERATPEPKQVPKTMLAQLKK